MAKILGLCIVLFTICYVCKRVDAARQERLSVTLELVQLLDYLRDGISVYMRPLPQLLREFRWEHLPSLGFPDALISPSEQSLRPLSEAVGEKVRDIVIPLFSTIGMHTYAEQLSLLDRARERLRAVAETEGEDALRTSRLLRTLGVSLSLAITILTV